MPTPLQKKKRTKKGSVKHVVSVQAVTLADKHATMWVLALSPANCVILSKLFNSSDLQVPNLWNYGDHYDDE